MATVREYYDTTAKALNAQREWQLSSDGGQTTLTVFGKVSHCIEENAKYWSFYLPADSEINCLSYLLSQPHVSEGIIGLNEPEQEIGFADTPERQKLSSFVFTRRVYVYIDKTLCLEEIKYLKKLGSSLNFNIRIRDKLYVSKCTELSQPLAFISHDSRDKDDLVRELAMELDRQLCNVWYDEFSLNVGDSLRESIERGLKESRKCVIIISPSFIANNGWTKKEFNAIFTREVFEKENVILPVWHNVTPEQVYGYSAELLDRVALNSSLGTKELAKKLAQKIQS
ncbi:MAG: hypothetical protein ACJA2U_000495 [Marinomonas primoryensis]|jgi:hypothetical protein